MDPTGLDSGSLIAGRFLLDKKVGTGGMGSVHRARDTLTGQLVALKVLHAPGEHAERFARETAALAEISHPGAVRYVAHGMLPTGEPYLAMQWIEGETLAKRLQRGALTVGETLVIGERIAAALGSAHARGLVHRDVKPANIMLADGSVQRAMLVDFGLARRSTAAELTKAGMLVGTPRPSKREAIAIWARRPTSSRWARRSSSASPAGTPSTAMTS
jgi:serine/threonine protein kinase